MLDKDEIAATLEDIVVKGRADMVGSSSLGEGIAFHYMQHDQFLLLNESGARKASDLARTLQGSPELIESLSFSDVQDVVHDVLLQGVTGYSNGSLEALALADVLVNRLTEGLKEWHFLAIVPGLLMAPGQTICIAGITIGPLSDEERSEHVSRAERIGATAFFIDNREPGSAREHMVSQSMKYLEGSDSWARGIIRCHEPALDHLVEQRLDVIVLNVLRFFGPLVGQDPDTTHLGVPRYGEVNKVLHYEVLERGQVDRYVEGRRAFGHRLPFVLSIPAIQRLAEMDSFLTVRHIVDKWMQNPDSVNDLENKILLAVLQFGTASTLTPIEVKLQNYLTVLETLYGRDLEDANDDHRKAARRLSASFDESARSDFRSEVNRLYGIRRRPVHYGDRNLRGREVVAPDDVHSAQRVALQAVLFALERCPGLSHTPDAHKTFLDSLDQETSTVPTGKREYVFVTQRDPTTGTYRSTCPDFPTLQGEGVDEMAAFRDARAKIEVEITRRKQAGQPVPESTVNCRKPQLTI